MNDTPIHRPLRRVAWVVALLMIMVLARGAWQTAGAAKPLATFTVQCSVSGQTVAIWKGVQLSRVDFSWYSSSDGGQTFTLISTASFPVKKKPSGSVSAPSPSGTFQGDAYFYDASGTVVGSAYQNCSP